MVGRSSRILSTSVEGFQYLFLGMASNLGNGCCKKYSGKTQLLNMSDSSDLEKKKAALDYSPMFDVERGQFTRHFDDMVNDVEKKDKKWEPSKTKLLSDELGLFSVIKLLRHEDEQFSMLVKVAKADSLGDLNGKLDTRGYEMLNMPYVRVQ